MYEELVDKLKSLFEKRETVILAISGHGGSGKSTLASRLAKDFDIAENQIVRIDSIHSKDYLRVDDLFKAHEWAIIFDLLSNLHKTDRLKYRTRDWKGNEGEIDVPKPNLVIVEGIRLIRPDTQALFDLSVWVDCPVDIASNRAKDRNKEQGDSKEELELWDTKWIPEAKKYEEQVHPEKLADFIYSTA